MGRLESRRQAVASDGKVPPGCFNSGLKPGSSPKSGPQPLTVEGEERVGIRGVQLADSAGANEGHGVFGPGGTLWPAWGVGWGLISEQSVAPEPMGQGDRTQSCGGTRREAASIRQRPAGVGEGLAWGSLAET